MLRSASQRIWTHGHDMGGQPCSRQEDVNVPRDMLRSAGIQPASAQDQRGGLRIAAASVLLCSYLSEAYEVNNAQKPAGKPIGQEYRSM